MRGLYFEYTFLDVVIFKFLLFWKRLGDTPGLGNEVPLLRELADSIVCSPVDESTDEQSSSFSLKFKLRLGGLCPANIVWGVWGFEVGKEGNRISLSVTAPLVGGESDADGLLVPVAVATCAFIASVPPAAKGPLLWLGWLDVASRVAVAPSREAPRAVVLCVVLGATHIPSCWGSRCVLFVLCVLYSTSESSSSDALNKKELMDLPESIDESPSRAGLDA
jgi:hypothetical protein